MIENVEHIFIENRARDYTMVHDVLARYPDAEVTYCDAGDRDALAKSFGRAPRKAVFLKHHDGAFLKPFPRHPWYDKGGGVYYNLILGYNCFGSCHYCFIQTIFDDAIPTVYVNDADMCAQLREFLQKDPAAWISTGEYIDSLQLDEATRYTERVCEVMRDFPDATLELRTKSGRVDHLPPSPQARVSVAYSISPRAVVEAVEPGTANLERRLRKARFLADLGYRIVVRVDPIITTPQFADAYAELPQEIERYLGWANVAEVFLGALRFDDDLLQRMAGSTAARRLLATEYTPCPDGKYRPQRYERVEMYKRLVGGIREFEPDIDITIMMEPDYVQDAVFARAT